MSDETTRGKLMFVPRDWRSWQKDELKERMERYGYHYVGKIKSVNGEYWGFVLNKANDDE